MAAGVNKAILIGNLGNDPEIRYLPNGRPMGKLRLATSVKFTKDGVEQERTDWHRVTVWGKQAEICREYLKKGRQIFVEGEIRNRSYMDERGEKRWTTEIQADRVRFLGGGPREPAPPDRDPDSGAQPEGAQPDSVPPAAEG